MTTSKTEKPKIDKVTVNSEYVHENVFPLLSKLNTYVSETKRGMESINKIRLLMSDVHHGQNVRYGVSGNVLIGMIETYNCLQRQATIIDTTAFTMGRSSSYGAFAGASGSTIAKLILGQAETYRRIIADGSRLSEG